jgi:regulatory protein
VAPAASLISVLQKDPSMTALPLPGGVWHKFDKMPAYQQSRRERKRPEPLDEARLRALALFYLGRYATSSGRLRAYLRRKIAEHGWADESDPPIDAVIDQCIQLGYVDDQAFAQARAATLIRRGYGPEKVKNSLRAAGVAHDQADQSSSMDNDARLVAALIFARRKRLGPFSKSESGTEIRQKTVAAFIRAGHGFDVVSQVIAMNGDDASKACEAGSTKHM